LLEPEALAAPSVAAPVRQQEGGRTRVADDSAVGAPVGEPDDGTRMQEHLADRFEVEARVVEEWKIQQLVAVPLDQSVVRHFLRGDAPSPRDCGDARLCGGLVVRRVAEREDLVERGGEIRQDRAAELDTLGQYAPLRFRVLQAPDTLGEREIRERTVR